MALLLASSHVGFEKISSYFMTPNQHQLLGIADAENNLVMEPFRLSWVSKP